MASLVGVGSRTAPLLGTSNVLLALTSILESLEDDGFINANMADHIWRLAHAELVREMNHGDGPSLGLGGTVGSFRNCCGEWTVYVNDLWVDVPDPHNESTKSRYRCECLKAMMCTQEFEDD